MSSSFEIREVSWESHREALLLVRKTVFVIEQKVPEEIEVDEFDPVSIHLLACDDENRPIGTARLLPSGKIGRVAVLKNWRRHGVGSSLMRHLLARAEDSKLGSVSLHAQLESLPFYESLGFEAHGPIFDEAGIPHRSMALTLT